MDTHPYHIPLVSVTLPPHEVSDLSPSSSSLVPKQHPTLQLATVLVSSCPGPGLREIKELQEEEEGKILLITYLLWGYLLRGFSACWMWLRDLKLARLKSLKS